VDQDAALAGLADALDALATFVEARETRLGRVTPQRLRAPLARHLKSARASAKA
jgi:hypothetical protein